MVRSGFLNWLYVYFRLDSSWLWEAVLCTIGCLAVSLASIHWMTVEFLPLLLKLWQPKMPPYIAKYLLVAKSVPHHSSPIENLWVKLLVFFIYITDLVDFLTKRNRKKTVYCLRSQTLGADKSWPKSCFLSLFSLEDLDKSLKFCGPQCFSSIK